MWSVPLPSAIFASYQFGQLIAAIMVRVVVFVSCIHKVMTTSFICVMLIAVFLNLQWFTFKKIILEFSLQSYRH
jgi:hypothetical protein